MTPNVVSARFGLWVMMSILATAGLSGCEEEKPYTPFQVATALPEELNAPQPSPTETSVNSPSAPLAEGEKAPPNSAAWRWGDVTLRAPRGLSFSSGLRLGAPDTALVAAWVLPDVGCDTKCSERAGLYLFNRDGATDRRLQTISELLPSGKDCTYSTQLSTTGPKTITSRLEVECQGRSLPNTPMSAVNVLRPLADDPLLFEIFAAESAPGETISLHVNSTDRDGDGVDDVEITVSLTAPSGAREELPLQWLTRSAGPSRQTDAPLQEITRRVGKLSVQAQQKAHRKLVPRQVDALRRLLGTLCDELGTPRVSLASGAKLNCGNLSPQLTRLVHLNTQAFLGNKELPSAVGEVVRAQWFAHKPSEKEQLSLAELLAPHLKKQPAQQLARFDVDVKLDTAPQKSPLLFADDGQLWAKMTDGKVKRLTMRGDPPLPPPPSSDGERDSKDAGSPPPPVIPPVDLIAHGPGGRYLASLVPSCERSEIQLVFGSKSGPPLPAFPIDLLAPRPGNCREFSQPPLRVEVLGWQSGKLALLLGGQVFWTGGEAQTLPFAVAFGTFFGLVVQASSELSLFSVEAADELHHCVVSPQASKIACLRKDSVFVFAPN